MDESRNLAQFSAARDGPWRHDPCEVMLQLTVQGLRDALRTALNQIKSLTEENTALKEKVSLLENAERVESQLQEELKRKDGVLKKAVKRRQARTREYINCLDLLTKTELRLKRSKKQAKARCNALEVSPRDELAQREESCRKCVQEVEKERSMHREEGLRKEEEWRRKESLAEEKISFLISKNKQLQELTSTKRREWPQQETELHNRQTDKVQKKPESHGKDKFKEETTRSREKQISEKKKKPKKARARARKKNMIT